MDKRSTSARDAQAQRIAMKRQRACMITEAMLGAGLSKWEAESLVGTIEEVYFTDPRHCPVRDGQILYSCLCRDEGPGKPLSACRKVSVTLTLLDPQDKQELQGSLEPGGMSAQIRQRRIARITEEAYEQGGLLTQEDLSELLMCDPRTIRRDINALKTRGFVLPTRGQQQDIGPGVSHRTLAVGKWLEGAEPVEIARAIRHSLAAVENYLEKFKRVAWLSREKGFNAFEIALAVGMSVASTRTYLEICEQYAPTAGFEQRIYDIETVGKAFYTAQDEKKRSNYTTDSNAGWRCK